MARAGKEEYEKKMAIFNGVKAEVEMFVAHGGDLRSPEAAPLGVRFLKATSDMWEAAGGEPFVVPINKPTGSEKK